MNESELVAECPLGVKERPSDERLEKALNRDSGVWRGEVGEVSFGKTTVPLSRTSISARESSCCPGPCLSDPEEDSTDDANGLQVIKIRSIT